VYSSGLDDRVQHVANRVILAQDGGFYAVDLTLLFADALLKVRELTLERLHNFLRDLLLLVQGMRA